MAGEAQLRSSLSIRKGNQVYQSAPTYFTADVDGVGGPTPGLIRVPTTGVEIDLSALTTPGLCRLQNIDSTNYVTIGVYDGSRFFPVLELKAGESYPLRLSRHLNAEYVGTGTGTNSDINKLWAVANTASIYLLVEAFEA